MNVGERMHGYHSVRMLGQGNFSKVCLVEDERGKRYACKISANTELLKREEDIMERLEHPLFPRFQEYWQEGEGYLVMEYLPGSTLKEMLGRRGGFSDAVTIEAGLELASGLAYLHEKHGLLYRDMKPQNVILGENGRVKLVDLGCVSLFGEKTRTIAGTPGFAAPEQMRVGEVLNQSCDVYGLGKTLAAMLGERKSSRRLGRTLDACTAEERERRFPDMRSMIEALAKCGKPGASGWENEIRKGRLRVEKNIYQSRYKNS